MAERRRGRQRGKPAPADIDGVLIRMIVAEGHWAESIPPVPQGRTVTVSFASNACADEHGEALELLGYRLADVTAIPDVPVSRVADFLLTADVIEEHPTYWRSMAEHGTRAYHLSLGPAAAAVAEIVAAHAPLLQREAHSV